MSDRNIPLKKREPEKKCMVWGCEKKPTHKVVRDTIIFLYCEDHYIKYGNKRGYSHAKYEKHYTKNKKCDQYDEIQREKL